VVRDPQALTLISSSLKALTGGVTVNDVILQAAAAYAAGSDEESGTATLIATSRQESLVQLSLTEGSRQELRDTFWGAWSGPDAATHCMAPHNCWTAPGWFFPALILEAISSDPTLSASYLGPDSSQGSTLLHVQVARVLAGQPAVSTADVLRLSVMDLYFDPNSMLPLVLDFSAHPDSNPNVNIPVEIQFGNFQSNNGGLVPFHIQKFILGTLMLDFTVASVQLNSGVPDSQFATPCAVGGQQ
jgi:hypothetical protein